MWDTSGSDQNKTVEDVIAAFEAFEQTGTAKRTDRISPSEAEVLGAITANLKSGVTLLEENLTYLFIGNGVYDSTGLSPADISPGDRLRDMHALMIEKGLLSADFVNANLPIPDQLNASSTPDTAQTSLITKLGNGRHVRLTRKTLPNGWIVSQYEDVTELAAKDEILEKALSLGDAGLWTYDFETAAYSFSKTISDLFSGEDAMRLKKHGILGIVHPEDHERYRMALRNISRTNDRFKITTRRNREPQAWVETSAQLLRNTDGSPKTIRAFERDVTKELLREKALEAAKDKAIAATSAKSEFLANMSHEIRTPMNGVLGMAELLAETDLTQKQRDYLKVINNSSHSLLTIINDILDFSKIEAGAMELDPRPFNLRDAIDDVMALLATKARAKGLELIVDYATDLPVGFVGDAGRIRQVITNLVGNAVKFTDSGTVILTVDAQTDTNQQCALTVTVKDTGIGFSETKVDGIFKKFTQADGSTTHRYGGTGLGLAICRHILGLMDGEMRVNSVPGQGSVFAFDVTLPTNDQADGLRAQPRRLPHLKALLVDDLDINLKVLAKRMTLWGARTSQALNAGEAVTLLTDAQARNEPFDLVITDNMMPQTSGLELAAMIKASAHIQTLPIIMMSSCDASMSAEEMKSIGISSFLIKPVREQRLFETLSKTVAAAQNAKVTDKPVETQSTPSVNSYDISAGMQATLDDITNALADVSPEPPVETPSERLTVKAPDKKPSGRTSVLVAEDFPLNQDVVRLMLAESHYDLQFAANGQIAVDMYKTAPTDFDLVLMDVSMPVMDGFEASEIIKSHQAANGLPEIPIIALTGHALKNDKEKCLDAAMDDYLTKPIKQTLLIQTLEKWSENPSPHISAAG